MATDADGRRREEALDLLQRELRRQGFATVRTIPGTNGGPRPDGVALARQGFRFLLVATEYTVDGVRTRRRLASCARRGPTLVGVPWHLEPRMRSNLERWRLPGVEVWTY